MPAFPPRPCGRIRQYRFSCPRRACTLGELLTVLAIIAILAGLTLGAVRGVRTRTAITQAKAELSLLAQALEAYRRHYGDYPRTGAMPQATPIPTDTITAGSAEAQLLNALAGKLGPALMPMDGEDCVAMDHFTLETSSLPDEATPAANCFLDPWGHRYLYYYRRTNGTDAWMVPGYVLYSAGPDGTHDAPAADGTCDVTTVNNADNLYANR